MAKTLEVAFCALFLADPFFFGMVAQMVLLTTNDENNDGDGGVGSDGNRCALDVLLSSSVRLEECHWLGHTKKISWSDEVLMSAFLTSLFILADLSGDSTV